MDKPFEGVREQMKHWRQDVRDGIVTLTLDVAGRSANVLSAEVTSELEALVGELEQRLGGTDAPRGVVFRSGKQKDFILGADINEFQHIDAGAATAMAARVHIIYQRIAELAVPTVVLIHGNCLGGGLELALACDYRIATDDARTRLGLPEVQLGIVPGFGGTIRLPRLIGPLPALNMMLSGRPLSARAAKHVGLVDAVVPARHLEHAATDFVKRRPRRARPGRVQRWLATGFLRPWVAWLVARQLRKRARRDQYPAPWRVLDLWRRRGGVEEETRALGELLAGPVSRNLVHLFLASEALKRQGREAEHRIRHVHVIGAGVMGGDIASWAAFKGFTVSVHDRSEESIARAMKRAHGLFRKKLKAPGPIQAAMDRLMPDLRGDGLRHADLVIEAVAENLDVKRAVFSEAEKHAPPGAILATNTSSIPLEEIATSLKEPARLIGLHFFNPVAKMQLVEVVRGTHSGDDFVRRGASFTVALSRLPLLVRSSPGFLVNRILMPYLMEAMVLVGEGVPLADIDRAATDFGMPMGPIHLADTVGLDICLSVAEELAEPLGMTVPSRLRSMVDKGHLGRKSGRGFYRYDKDGQPRRGRGRARDDIPLTDRLILRQLNEAAACLREQVVANGEAVDVGMVYGTGFAPFRGGPVRYARVEGIDSIEHRLHRLVEANGPRFQPDPGWEEMAAEPAPQ
jgi:3-hydroxyacyl-CoA dehydrogenase/enoyl-CoA hydratase/3-hydroxybutyryl-CoA epimerase